MTPQQLGEMVVLLDKCLECVPVEDPDADLGAVDLRSQLLLVQIAVLRLQKERSDGVTDATPSAPAPDGER